MVRSLEEVDGELNHIVQLKHDDRYLASLAVIADVLGSKPENLAFNENTTRGKCLSLFSTLS